MRLGRFRKEKTDYIFEEIYLPKSGLQEDQILYSDLFDRLLEEITKSEADKIITTELSR